jgi:hypothetical protein
MPRIRAATATIHTVWVTRNGRCGAELKNKWTKVLGKIINVRISVSAYVTCHSRFKAECNLATACTGT